MRQFTAALHTTDKNQETGQVSFSRRTDKNKCGLFIQPNIHSSQNNK